jgi:hypothetical protein
MHIAEVNEEVIDDRRPSSPSRTASLRDFDFDIDGLARGDFGERQF